MLMKEGMIADQIGFDWMLVLGQAEKVDPVFFHQWMVSLGAIGLLFLTGLKIAELIRGKKAVETVLSPDPLRFQKVQDLATKAELEATRRALEDDLGEIKRANHEDREIANQALLRVHGRIDTVANHSAEMAGELKQISKALERLLMIATERPRD